MPVNGAFYSWEDIKILGPTGLLVNVASIEYSSEREIEPVYGQGAAPRGVGRGNFKGEGKLTLLKEDYDLLVLYVGGTGKGIYGLSPFTITVTYQNEDQGVRIDQLLRCRFKKVDRKAAQGDKKLEVALDFLFEDIEDSGVSQTSGLNFV